MNIESNIRIIRTNKETCVVFVVHDCKERWKNLRGSYTRHLKSVYGDGKRRPYYLADHLSFLHPFTKTRAMKLNDTSPESPEQDTELHPPIETKYLQDINSQSSHQSSCEEDSASSLATAPRNKRKGKLVSYETMLAKRTSTNGSTTASNSGDGQNPDPDYSFLLSVLPDMQEMNSEQKRRFKIGILNLAGQILKKT